jgi:hypothetical protein
VVIADNIANIEKVATRPKGFVRGTGRVAQAWHKLGGESGLLGAITSCGGLFFACLIRPAVQPDGPDAAAGLTVWWTAGAGRRVLLRTGTLRAIPACGWAPR